MVALTVQCLMDYLTQTHLTFIGGAELLQDPLVVVPQIVHLWGLLHERHHVNSNLK